LGPADPSAHRTACAVLTSIANYPEALEHGFLALEFGDQSDRTFGQIGYILKMTGRPDLALRWFEKVRLTQEGAAGYDALIGDCWADLLQDERAAAAYQSAASVQPDHADGWTGLCWLRLLASDYAGAREIYLKELPKYPQSQNGRRMAALIEFLRRNIPEAEKQYRELTQDDPLGGIKGGFYGAVDYRSALACLHLLSGRGDEARAIILECLAAEQKRVDKFPADPSAHYRKAALKSMLGEEPEALAELENAVDCGWIDFRAMQMDPRFDRIARTPEFAAILAKASRKVEALLASPIGISLAQKTK
jgi:tetratricopeptide (TPR) repeat protein